GRADRRRPRDLRAPGRRLPAARGPPARARLLRGGGEPRAARGRAAEALGEAPAPAPGTRTPVSRALRPLAPRLALLLSLPALACATGPRAPRPLPAEDPRPAALLSGLAHAAEGRRTLRGVAQLALEGPNGSGRARQVLVLERPARLRVEGLGVLDPTLLVLTTAGGRSRLLRVPERSFDSGPVYPDLLRDVAGLAVTPEQAVELLLGVPLPPAGTHIEGAALLGEGGMRVEVGAGGSAGRQV